MAETLKEKQKRHEVSVHTHVTFRPRRDPRVISHLRGPRVSLDLAPCTEGLTESSTDRILAKMRKRLTHVNVNKPVIGVSEQAGRQDFSGRHALAFTHMYMWFVAYVTNFALDFAPPAPALL